MQCDCDRDACSAIDGQPPRALAAYLVLHVRVVGNLVKRPCDRVRRCFKSALPMEQQSMVVVRCRWEGATQVASCCW